jgi:hypothetical protein
MSYEPMILIRRSSLEAKRKEIEEKTIYGSGNEKMKKEDNDAWLAVYNALETKDCDTVKFPEIELIIITPELTTHNKKVRKILDDLEIDYRVDF